MGSSSTGERRVAGGADRERARRSTFACGGLSLLAVGLVVGALGCGSAKSDLSAPAAVAIVGPAPRVELPASASAPPVVSLPASTPAAPAAGMPVATREIVVRKPELPDAVTGSSSLGAGIASWEDLSTANDQLDRDIDQWIAACRPSIPAASGHRLALLRKLYGTGSFLREAEQYLKQSTPPPEDQRFVELTRLSERWTRLQEDLGRLAREPAEDAPER